MKHPTEGDKPQGTDISFPEHRPGNISILVWRGYSPFTGRYNATYVDFHIEVALKTIRVLKVCVKEPFLKWRVIKNHQTFAYITDHIRRTVRKAVSELMGSTHWRITVREVI